MPGLIQPSQIQVCNQERASQHLTNTFPVHDQALSVSFGLLSQQHSEENLSMVVEERGYSFFPHWEMKSFRKQFSTSTQWRFFLRKGPVVFFEKLAK
jgi:hypothetical protein